MFTKALSLFAGKVLSQRHDRNHVLYGLPIVILAFAGTFALTMYTGQSVLLAAISVLLLIFVPSALIKRPSPRKLRRHLLLPRLRGKISVDQRSQSARVR
jgi:hypothetical protein